MTTPGEFVNKALIPVWVLPVVGAVLAAALMLGSIGLLRAQQGGPLPTPTQAPKTVLTQVPKTPPGATAPTGPSPTAPTGPSPSPNPSPSPTISAGNVTPVVTALHGAIGSQYVPSQDRLYFVEFNTGALSALDNASRSSPTYRVLGTGYTQPEGVYVTKDGNTAYITERIGNLLSVPLRDRKSVV